ncbi:hypothetical protein [Phytoactinopolyspora endophytica]|uniref:hypothetical protein n=1 Tax=Phytoactinopolyspora endophytica TaxID=1642495 RepID=UPI00101C2BEE|nr:hypothetical protein [Phytoactinopolyspora endophytica]
MTAQVQRRPGRRPVWLAVVASIATLTCVAMAIQPAAAQAGADAPYLDDDATAEDLKEANAWVPAEQQLRFGAKPLQYVRDAAGRAANQAGCSISKKNATALVTAMTWPESSPSGAAPSPMTLSRYDNQTSLGDPKKRAPGLWFHPGIGMWQLDSAGLGTDFTAAQAIDSKHAAERMAPYIVNKYCARRNNGDTPKQARVRAWSDWVACRQGACENTYQRARNGITAVDGVGRYGGAKMRTCWYQDAARDCLFVDPSNAQGAAWWTAPGGGRSPVAAPFYVLRLGGSNPTEVRYWLSQDSGASTDVEARRPFGVNARNGLRWSTGPGICDLSTWRGDC